MNAPPVFYLGTPSTWLWNGLMSVLLFVSHARLRDRKSAFPAAVVPGWALDSMGFTMLRDNGRWTITPREYVEAVIRYDREIGRMQWAAPQDHMCERPIIEGGMWNGQKFTGTRQFLDPGHALTYEQIAELHQRFTVANYLELRSLWEEYRRRGDTKRECPFRPVLQGDSENPASHLRCAQMYEDAGVRLGDQELVGVGSVCRLQSEKAIGDLARALGPLNLRTHWFGVKLAGLPEIWPHIDSHDSAGWSAEARRRERLPGCVHVRVRGKYVGQPSTCANCPRGAMDYHGRVMRLHGRLMTRDHQPELFNPHWVDAA